MNNEKKTKILYLGKKSPRNESVDEIDLKDTQNLRINLLLATTDLSYSLENRIKYLEILWSMFGDEAVVEVISKLSMMFQLGGTKTLERYLYYIIIQAEIPEVIKLNSVKALCSRKSSWMAGPKALNIFSRKMIKGVLPTPCKFEMIKLLMGEQKYPEMKEFSEQAIGYFVHIVNDQKIECDYRYKAILSLENLDSSRKFYFMKISAWNFLIDKANRTLYRILAAQMLIQKKLLNKKELSQAELILLSFSQDPELDYNLRADSADVILGMGSEESKQEARKIIQMLGRQNRNVRTIFQNAQNVHIDEIEESVREIIEFLSSMEIHTGKRKGEQTPDFSVIKKSVQDKLDRELKDLRRTFEEIPAEIRLTKSMQKKWENDYKPEYDDRVDKIMISLNRILIDRALYSKFNCTLNHILTRVWIYIQSHKAREAMEDRLTEELFEMSGTCSSGFASRLVNVISGFGQFNLRISWRDQIIANFTGRLNARARALTKDDNLEILENNFKLYCAKSKNKMDSKFEKEYKKYVKFTDEKQSEEKERVKSFDLEKLREKKIRLNKEYKIEELEKFQECVLEEMCLKSSDFASRRNFLKFFRKNMLSIREELYEEFQEYIDDTSYDLYFRSAVSLYETGGYV